MNKPPPVLGGATLGAALAPGEGRPTFGQGGPDPGQEAVTVEAPGAVPGG